MKAKDRKRLIRRILRLTRRFFEAVGWATITILVAVSVMTLWPQTGLTVKELAALTNEYWAYNGTIFAIAGSLVAAWFLYRAVILQDFPFTLLALFCFPTPIEAAKESECEDKCANDFEICVPAYYRDKLPTVWDYFLSTLLVIFARFKANQGEIPSIILWKKLKEPTGIFAYPPFSWLVSLINLFKLSPDKVFGPLLRTLSKDDHAWFEIAVTRAWDLAECYPEHIPEGMQRPTRRIEESFIVILAYDTQKADYTSLTALILPEIYVIILDAIRDDEQAKKHYRLHPKFHRGENKAYLVQRAIHALRLTRKRTDLVAGETLLH